MVVEKRDEAPAYIYITIDNSTLLSVNQVLQGLQKQMVQMEDL